MRGGWAWHPGRHLSEILQLVVVSFYCRHTLIVYFLLQNNYFQPRTTATRMPNRNQQIYNMGNSQQIVPGQVSDSKLLQTKICHLILQLVKL